MEEQQRWDLEAVYDEKISPLMAQIVAICKEHQLPMLATFQYGKGDEDEGDFCTTRISRKGESKSLGAAFQMVRNGFLAYAVTSRGGNPGDRGDA